jgi:hypothetical protein
LASGAAVSEATVKRLEAADGELGGRPKTVAAIVRALESAGVEFIAENGGGAGVRLRKAKEPVQPAQGEGGIIEPNDM